MSTKENASATPLLDAVESPPETSQATSPIPAALPRLNAVEFRQRLAGLIDPQERLTAAEFAPGRELAAEFVGMLPELYGDSLDRLKLWDRIGSALETAHAKTAGHDVEFFVSNVLEHLKCEPARAARHWGLSEFIETQAAWSPEQSSAFLSYLATHRPVVLVKARMIWERTKESRAAERSSAANENAIPQGPTL